MFARRWLYRRRLIIVHDRALRSMIAGALRQHEAALGRRIHAAVERDRIEHWQKQLLTLRAAGVSHQSWLWAAPAKHSPRQIDELIERIESWGGGPRAETGNDPLKHRLESEAPHARG